MKVYCCAVCVYPVNDGRFLFLSVLFFPSIFALSPSFFPCCSSRYSMALMLLYLPLVFT